MSLLVRIVVFSICRVMVLDQGYIAEFDSPTKLLQNADSPFTKMARDAGLLWTIFKVELQWQKEKLNYAHQLCTFNYLRLLRWVGLYCIYYELKETNKWGFVEWSLPCSIHSITYISNSHSRLHVWSKGSIIGVHIINWAITTSQLMYNLM